MTISTDPDILFVFNESTGTSVPNLNTGNSAGTIGVHAAGTAQYDWNQDAGSYEGFLDINESGSGTRGNMTFVTTAETFASTTVDESVAMRFQIQEADNLGNGGHIAVSAASFDPAGMISIEAQPPTTGGGSPNDFDLLVTMQVTAAIGSTSAASTVFQDLTFGTDYALACSVDRSTDTACVSRFKLNAETEYNPSNTDQSGWALDTVGPSLGKPWNFTNYYGVQARLYYYAYWRGYAISSADLALCNSDPDTTIPLWPGGGPSGPDFPQGVQGISQGFNPQRSTRLGGELET